MAPGVILEILDQGETLGCLDHRVTKEEQDSTTLDQEDPLETEVNQVREDPEGAEGIAVPKERLDLKDHQEPLGNQASRGSLEREDPEESKELMGNQDQGVILASLTVMS